MFRGFLTMAALLQMTIGDTIEQMWDVQLSYAAPDCVQREVFKINGQMPGPEIRASPGDTIVIHVTNLVPGTGLVVHWHSIKMDNPWMQGGDTTMCPIHFGSSFTFTFTLDPSHKVGTYWYHAHSQGMMFDGVSGPFIIEETLNSLSEYSLPAYDSEMTIMMVDWNHAGYLNVMSRGSSWEYEFPLSKPTFAESVLFNGKARYDCETYEVDFPYECKNYTAGECGELERINGESGDVIRLRFIHAGVHALLEVKIANHTMVVWKADGTTLDGTLEVDTLRLSAGQRYDVLVTLNQPEDVYWIESYALDEPPFGKNGAPASGLAVLEYSVNGSFSGEEPNPNSTFTHEDDVGALTDQELLLRRNPSIGDEPPSLDSVTRRIKLTFVKNIDYRDPSTGTRYPGINFTGIQEAYDAGEYFWLGMDEYVDNITDDLTRFITSHAIQVDDGDWESSWPTNVPKLLGFYYDTDAPTMGYVEIETGDVVEVILHDLTMADPRKGAFCGSHPIHMHGYQPWVVAQGYGEWNGSYRNLSDIVERDVMTMTPGVKKDPTRQKMDACSHLVIRFIAYQPGGWDLHCHNGLHFAQGMRFFFLESLDQIEAPPDEMVMCGSLATVATDATCKETDSVPVWTYVIWIIFVVKICILYFVIFCCMKCAPDEEDSDITARERVDLTTAGGDKNTL